MKSFDKLKAKLAELFQLDQADLDFGIYRIMNAKREEITRFLEHDLLPQVREAFAQYKSGDKCQGPSYFPTPGAKVFPHFCHKRG